MSVIAISRGSLLAAERLAEGLGTKLGSRVVDREQVIAVAHRYGIDQTGISHENIVAETPPGFWEQYADARHHYLTCFKAALLEFAIEGPLVYHGNLAHVLLNEVPCVLRVRVVAPSEDRVAGLMAQRGYSRERALTEIREMDARRRRWIHFLYDTDSVDPIFFDLVLNLHKMGIEDAVDLVAAETRKPPFQRTEQSVKALRNLHLSTVAEAHLLHNPETYGLHLRVGADTAIGEVTVTGEPAVLTQTAEGIIRSVLAGVPGVRVVRIEVSS